MAKKLERFVGMESMDGPKLFRWLLLAAVFSTSGCATGITPQRANLLRNAIPAHRVPDSFKPVGRDNLVPIDFSQLRQLPSAQHRIGSGDVLGVYIQNVLDGGDRPLPSVHYSNQPGLNSPAVGHPVEVLPDGTIPLPLTEPVHVAGMTLSQAVEAIKRPYVEKQILPEQNALITIDLVKPRSVGVYVMREDDEGTAGGTLGGGTALRGRRTAYVEMSVGDNNVLRALIESGGLPSTSAYNEIWILRSNGADELAQQALLQHLSNGQDPAQLAQAEGTSFTRVPLRVCPGQPLPFTQEDIILQNGDVIFIERRDVEFFLTGGLISGGRFEIPRDHDLDVLEALAIAGTNINGPAGNATATLFRSGPGNIIPPTRVIVVRKLPTGEQVKILVDLKAALNDPNERLTIMSRDVIILRYKPHELLANIGMNFVNVGYAIPNR